MTAPSTPSSPDSSAAPASSTPSSLTVLTGASRGMGLAIARQLVASGHRLLCLSRGRSDTLQADALAHGVPLEQWQVDLSQPREAAQRLANWLAGCEPSVHDSVTLINNAGVVPAIAPMRELPADEIAAALRVGLEAPMLLTAAFLSATRHWRATRRVLNISSGLGRRPMASQAPYCAAKAGLDHFTRCLALEEAAQPRGARVCSLAPGVIDTDMQAHLRAADASAFPDVSGFRNLKSQGQLTSADEAARRVLAFLARADFGAEPVADVRG